MARSEARIFTTIWQDDDFIHLSVGAQRMYLLLLSQGGRSYCGVMGYTPRRWSRLSPETSVDDATTWLEELVDRRFVVVDEDAEELWVRSSLKHDPGVFRSWNLIMALARDFATIASDPIRKGVEEGVREGLAKEIPKGVPEGFRDRLPEGFRGLLPEGFPKGVQGSPVDPPPKGLSRARARASRAASASSTATSPSQTAPPSGAPAPAETPPTPDSADLRSAEMEMQGQVKTREAGGGGVDQDEFTPVDGDPDFERFAAIWPGRPRMRAECRTVMRQCREIAADELIDEAIGFLLEQDTPPRHPSYLLATVRDWLRQRGGMVDP